MKTIAALRQAAAVVALSSTAFAQTATPATPLAGKPLPPAYAAPLVIDRGAAATWQGLQKLHTRASMLTINAHPDDEDGAMIAYESRGKGVESSLFVLTRGEGGQNVMSADYWDQLGILRTQELLDATQYEGTHLYFGHFADYGFSKTLEEALKQWGHDRVLYDAVRIVRILRPMVINSSFNGNVADGHGHHQTAGLMAQEVFNAAADPKMFPDQIAAGLLPWAPLKVYGRVPFARVTEKGIYDYATGKWEPLTFVNHTNQQETHQVPPTTVEIPSGSYSPVLAASYTTIAREGLSQQRSQNGGVAPALPGPGNTPYHLWATRVTKTEPTHEEDFFDGIDTSVPAIADYLPAAQRAPWRTKLSALNATVDDARARFRAEDPAAIGPALAKGLQQALSLIAEIEAASQLPAESRYNMLHELRVKENQFRQTLNNALGISLIASVAGGGGRGGSSTSQTVIPGQQVQISLHFANQGTQPVTLSIAPAVLLEGKAVASSQPKDPAVGPNKTVDITQTVTVPAEVSPTQPYFSRPNLEQPYYDIHTPEALALPVAPYPLTASVSYTFAGVTNTVVSTVQSQHRYNGPGTVYEPLLIAPAISVTVAPHAGIVPLAASSFTLNVSVHSSVKGPAKGEVVLDLPAGWKSSPVSAAFSTIRDGDEQAVSFTVTPAHVEAQPYTLTAIATWNGKQYRNGFITTGYVGARPYPSYREASYRTTGTDVKVAPNLRVAYIMGTGDEVPQTLADLGIHPTFLSPEDVAHADLSTYDAILLGIRTYAARPELKTFNNRLNEYVRNGGNVIAQYQNGGLDRDFAPYAISVPGDAEKVVEEDCKVTLLDPKDPALSWPNQITTADFDGWIEERGHGFATTWGPEFIAPTEMHDVGQDPQKGGLLYARYGKGTYVYLAYAFFRQMPDGVPGSFRIMANLLSLQKNPALGKK